MDACLSPGEMERLAHGELRGGARARAEAHLGRCSACRSRVEAHRPGPANAITTAGSRASAASAASAAAAARRGDDDETIEGFQLLDEIHRGGQGVVYRAVDELRGEIVALKILREGPFASADQRLRFDRESELARGLDHPFIVAPRISGVSRGRPYHVMPFVEGLTLDAWAREGEPTLRRRLEVFRDACDAVAHAHSRGVVHRDLKPSNILVDLHGRPHVVDFGVAKSSTPGVSLPLTVTGEFVGTLSHASPEQAKGDPRLVDERTDVYSLGVILYELLTGRMPYPVTGAPADVLEHVLRTEPRHPATISPAVDEPLAAIVLRALAKEPERRYPSVAALRDDVSAHLAGLPVRARPEGAWDLVAKAARRHRAAFAVAATFALGLALVAVLASVQARRFQVQRDRAEAAEAQARTRARELETATARARRQSYAANVLAADLALRLGRAGSARLRLDACPPEMRGWEWQHLALVADASEAAVPADGEAVLALGSLADGRAWRLSRSRVELLDAASLRTLESFPVPDVPRPDEAARVEILSLSADATLLALRWDDASWERMGAPGRSILVADRQGRIQAILEGAAWRADRAAFSGDGRQLVATTSESYDASPRAWSTLTGASRRFLSRAGGGPEGASPVAFSPDGVLLVEGGGDGHVRCWDTETGELAWEAIAHSRRVTTLGWSAGGQLVATGAADGSLRVHDRDGTLVAASSDLSLPAATRSVALDAFGQRLAAGDAAGNVAAWALPGGRQFLHARGHEAPVSAVAFAGAEGSLVSGGEDGSLQRWSAREGAGPAPLFQLADASAVAFDATGERLAVAGAAGLVRVIDTRSGATLLELTDEEGPIGALAFGPGGLTLITAGMDGEGRSRSVRAWELQGTPQSRILGDAAGVRALGVSAEGVVAALAEPGVLVSWSASGQLLGSVEIPTSPRCLALVRGDEGDQPASAVVGWAGGAVQSVRLRDGELGSLGLEGCAVAADGGSPAVACALRRAPAGAAVPIDAIASVRDRTLVACIGGVPGEALPLDATTLAWTPDGGRLLAGDARGGLVVLGLDPLEPLLELDAHDGPVSALAVSPDGRLVASAGPLGVRLHRTR